MQLLQLLYQSNVTYYIWLPFDYFSKFLMNVFKCYKHFQMFKPGSVDGRHRTLQIQTREPVKSVRTASNFSKRPWLEIAKEDTVHIKKINIIQHIA